MSVHITYGKQRTQKKKESYVWACSDLDSYKNVNKFDSVNKIVGTVNKLLLLSFVSVCLFVGVCFIFFIVFCLFVFILLQQKSCVFT